MVFVGVLDSEQELRKVLIKIISLLFENKINGNTIQIEIQIDNAFRIVNFLQGKFCHVKVKFWCNEDRELVYENWTFFSPIFFINEDLPRLTRRDNTILRT